MDFVNLISKIKGGDKDSFKVLYNRYAPLFKGVAYRYTGSADDSNDVVQEAFVKIYKNLNKYSFEGNFEGWMKRIVVNCSLDHIAKHKKIQFETEEALEDHRYMSWDLPVSEMSVEEIVALIDQLPQGYRTVFNLSVFEGFSHKEIGKQLGISESASRSQLTKAKVKLKTLLEGIHIFSATA